LAYFLVLSGFALLIAGGEIMVRGAVAIAQRLKVPPVVVGLTIVAIGTSAPELTVSIDAILKNAPDIVTGNVVGSNLSNILLVLGIAALIRPVEAAPQLIGKDGMVMVASAALLVGFAQTGTIGLVSGIFMLALYVAYIGYCYWTEQAGGEGAQEQILAEVEEHSGGPQKLYISGAMFLVGLAGVIFGADLLVEGAVTLARNFGLPEAVIALSVVAIGTSLPELAVSVIAACKGRSDVAVGNIVGSNISNVLFILGTTSIVAPIDFAAQIIRFDSWFMLATTVLLILVLAIGMRISRYEAAFFLGVYTLYIFAIFKGWPAALVGL
jgi:cation:H+ antiporter